MRVFVRLKESQLRKMKEISMVTTLINDLGDNKPMTKSLGPQGIVCIGNRTANLAKLCEKERDTTYERFKFCFF